MVNLKINLTTVFCCCIMLIKRYTKHLFDSEVFDMNSYLHRVKGFSVGFGYFGLVNGKYILFATEQEYREYLMEGAGNEAAYDRGTC